MVLPLQDLMEVHRFFHQLLQLEEEEEVLIVTELLLVLNLVDLEAVPEEMKYQELLLQ
jgi:hypothetical protein